MTDHSTTEFKQSLLDFLHQSPTPYHAVKNMVASLESKGFSQCHERDSWSLTPGKGYYITRNDSSIIAFRLAKDLGSNPGLVMFGAHTDSPCLKVKPKGYKTTHGYQQLDVEVYGGALLAPWFDRDLSLAGRVSIKHEGQCSQHLIDLGVPIATIPSLAIHLHREANSKNPINAQTQLSPLLGQGDGSLESIISQALDKQGIVMDRLLDHELLFYDTQPPAFIGINHEFIASARLDNLLSCYVGLKALLDTTSDQTVMLFCSDHEEVGSQSAQGAGGPMLEQCIERLIPDTETRLRTLSQSIMISTDNAHGIHPNYADKHDQQHAPLLNQGPVIKHNANQRYATNSETSSRFMMACEEAGVNYQQFVMRSDMSCGSTIGPITSAKLGIPVVDVGLPTFAMHSIRELAGSDDGWGLYQALLKV
ncbi:M18 family aminopeptidase [bacterium]|nr:M18 family aminopeptidase [bacterium]